MGNSQEYGVACLEDGVVVRGESKVGHAGKCRIHACKRLSGIGVGRNGHELKIGMGDEQARQLDSRISRCSNDANLDSHRFVHLQMYISGRFMHIYVSAPIAYRIARKDSTPI